MPRINYSNRANLDLIRLFRFLAEKDVPTAQRAIKEIRDSLTTLGRMPKVGILPYMILMSGLMRSPYMLYGIKKRTITNKLPVLDATLDVSESSGRVLRQS
jgi:plasmid stabilization system protein ParE